MFIYREDMYARQEPAADRRAGRRGADHRQAAQRPDRRRQARVHPRVHALREPRAVGTCRPGDRELHDPVRRPSRASISTRSSPTSAHRRATWRSERPARAAPGRHRGRQGERVRPRRRRRWRARSRTPAPICWRAPTSKKARRCARPACAAEILVFGALSVSDLDGLFDCRLTPTISTPGAARAVQAAAAQYKRRAALSPEDRHRHEPARVPARQPAAHAAGAARQREPRARGGLHALRDRRRSGVAAVRRAARAVRARAASTIDELDARSALGGQRPRVPYVHAANSAALLRDSRVWYDRVRPGLLLYGIVPPPLASTIAARRR